MADKLAMTGELGRFVGFDSLSGGGMASSSTTADQSEVGSCDHLMYNSDAHFMTVLKQLGKRDTTTKLKVCRVCVCVCVCARAHACLRVYVSVCVVNLFKCFCQNIQAMRQSV